VIEFTSEGFSEDSRDLYCHQKLIGYNLSFWCFFSIHHSFKNPKKEKNKNKILTFDGDSAQMRFSMRFSEHQPLPPNIQTEPAGAARKIPFKRKRKRKKKKDCQRTTSKQTNKTKMPPLS